MAFTILKMMKLPALNGAAIYAGKRGGNGTVRAVTMLESTDFGTGSMKGELVLTSAYILGLLSGGGVNYIAECHKREAVGICIKANSENFELSDKIESTANELGFPVIILPSTTDYCKIISEVTFEILRRVGYNRDMTYEENFFQELITSVQDQDTFIKRGAMLGMGKRERLCALLIQPDDRKISDGVREFCRSDWGRDCYTLTKNGRVLVALRLTVSEVEKNHVIRAAQELLKKLEDAMAPHTFRMGIGRCHKELVHFNKSFTEACSALSYSMVARSVEPIVHFEDLGLYAILFDYKNREDLFQLYQNTIGVIEKYDKENGTEYLETIRTYFSQNDSVNNTAKKMFVHYNTILYRLNKIKTIFGVDLNNEEQRVNLYVCLRTADSLDLWKTF